MGQGDRHLSHTNSKGILNGTFSVFGYYIDVRCKKEDVRFEMNCVTLQKKCKTLWIRI